MIFEVIHNATFVQPAGFTQGQFRKLDQLYSLASGNQTIYYRTVECDFDECVVSYTYYKTEYGGPYLQFIIRKIGPRTTMFELYKQSKGRIMKSGVFERTYEKLKSEIQSLS